MTDTQTTNRATTYRSQHRNGGGCIDRYLGDQCMENVEAGLSYRQADLTAIHLNSAVYQGRCDIVGRDEHGYLLDLGEMVEALRNAVQSLDAEASERRGMSYDARTTVEYDAEATALERQAGLISKLADNIERML